MRPICPACGHDIFKTIGQPGRAACRECGLVTTREAALMASLPKRQPAAQAPAAD